MTHDLLSIHKYEDEEARLHIAKVETDFGQFKILLSTEIKNATEHVDQKITDAVNKVEETNRKKYVSMRNIFSVWATIICALIASATAISTAVISANATKASIAQSKETTSQTITNEFQEKNQRAIDLALNKQRLLFMDDIKAYDLSHPIPLGRSQLIKQK